MLTGRAVSDAQRPDAADHAPWHRFLRFWGRGAHPVDMPANSFTIS